MQHDTVNAIAHQMRRDRVQAQPPKDSPDHFVIRFGLHRGRKVWRCGIKNMLPACRISQQVLQGPCA